ncbi:MAG: hypothetical protein WBC07_07360 [Methylotenera sp.]
MMNSRNNSLFHQRGGALIILVLVLVLAGLGTVFSVLNGSEVKVEREKITAAALVEAKVALLGRATADSNHPGSLPCPDNNSDGVAESTVTGPGGLCPSNIGRFPWKTLGTGPLLDGDGELLWYVFSQNYRDHVMAEPINGAVLGNLNVDGVTDHLAIILAARSPISAQIARPSNNVADYLEGENADGDFDFTKIESQIQNDRLITIGRAELFSMVSQRILREIRGDGTQGMIKYFNSNVVYPYADGNNDGNADLGVYVGTPSYQAGLNSLSFNATTRSMLLDNGWFPLLNYTISAAQDSAVLSLNGKTLSITP